MALSSTIFHSAWQPHMQLGLDSAMKGRIKIERVLTVGKFNPATGQIDGGTTKLLYLGKARIHKVARPVRREFVFDSSDNQVIRVQIPLDYKENEVLPAGPVSFQSNDKITVLANPLRPQSIGENYFIHSDAGSTEDLLMTLSCRYSEKQGN